MISYGFFRDDKNDKSMGRLLAFLMQVTGSVIVAVGLVLAIVVIVSKTGDVGAVVGLVGMGAGMNAAGPAMKNWSKGAEVKMTDSLSRIGGDDEDVVDEGLGGN